MSWKRVLRPTNLRMRLGVGLVLGALLCIQCSQTQANRSSAGAVTAINGVTIGQNSPAVLAEMERLARDDHSALLRRAMSHYNDTYRTYTCTFIKQERINGSLGAEQWIDVKFREQPFSVAMKWTKNPPKGERVLFVEGRNSNQMLVQPRGVLSFFTGGALWKEPTCAEAMQNTLRPVTMFGFKRMMENLLAVYDEAARNGNAKNSFLGYGQTAGGQRVMILQRELPQKDGYPAKITKWYLDCDHLVPVGMEANDWDDQLNSVYWFRDVKFNADLTDKDFTPEANGMKPK